MGHQRVWAEINLDYLAHNVKRTQEMLGMGTQIMAVVKGNAYGHGDRMIAAKLAELGIDRFAVSTLGEATSLRLRGIRGEILILGATPPDDFRQLADFNISQTVFSPDYAALLNAYAVRHRCRIPVHIKVDTGLNRIGFAHDQQSAMQAVFAYRGLSVQGIFTHFAAADLLGYEHVEFTKLQVKRFDACLQGLKGYPIGIAHVQNSAGIHNVPGLRYDYARPGVMLLGLQPGEISKDNGLLPVMQLKSTVTMVKRVRQGETIGYGRKFVASKDMLVATIPVGYGDGYPRALSGTGAAVLIHGQYAKQIGMICMDQLMVDVTEIHAVRPGDIVVLVGEDRGRSIDLDRLAELAGTISNEVASRIAERVQRIYIEQDSIIDCVQRSDMNDPAYEPVQQVF